MCGRARTTGSCWSTGSSGEPGLPLPWGRTSVAGPRRRAGRGPQRGRRRGRLRGGAGSSRGPRRRPTGQPGERLPGDSLPGELLRGDGTVPCRTGRWAAGHRGRGRAPSDDARAPAAPAAPAASGASGSGASGSSGGSLGSSTVWPPSDPRTAPTPTPGPATAPPANDPPATAPAAAAAPARPSSSPPGAGSAPTAPPAAGVTGSTRVVGNGSCSSSGTAPPPATRRVSASDASRIVGRWAGVGSSMASSTPESAPARRGGLIVPEATWCSRAIGLSPAPKGGVPSTAAYSVAPSEKTSAAGVEPPPRATSGAR